MNPCPINLKRCNRPGVSYFCDMDYDPFLMMQDEGKVYGMSILSLPPFRPLFRPSFRFFRFIQTECHCLHPSRTIPYKHRPLPIASNFCHICPRNVIDQRTNPHVHFACCGSGFTISLFEWEPTIPTLWNTVKSEWHQFRIRRNRERSDAVLWLGREG